MSTIIDSGGSPTYEGVGGERTDHHYDDLQQRHDPHYHSTQHQRRIFLSSMCYLRKTVTWFDVL